MSAKLLSEKALLVINQYKNFNVGAAVCSVPYYNNRKAQLRGGLKAQVGKGSPKDITEELETVARMQKINTQALDSITLKKILVDNNLGIDCSGFAYHVLNKECLARGKGEIKNFIFFDNATNFWRRFRAKTQPEKNIGAATFAHENNSRIVSLKDVQPGDFITMIGGPEGNNRDHIVVIHEVTFKDDAPVALSYTHSIAWPTDGEYGHGVRQGLIRIIDLDKPITNQEWIEENATGSENYTFSRALKSKTELRRLNSL